MGQHAPGTPTAPQVKNAVEDLALGIDLGTAARFDLRHEVLDQRPFSVTKIGRIGLSRRHAPQDTRSRSAQTSFLDTLLEAYDTYSVAHVFAAGDQIRGEFGLIPDEPLGGCEAW
jgi:hypothetical protein